ncbi:MAG TPA: Vms1/Ankzf1 family peptidyl-tRNA hydrolase [Nocardioidaceae bacterium]|nr:Vms1/Ankzf1 family peptidyl-tRNA hydrolase [Nocardioidaceae bacterium]
MKAERIAHLYQDPGPFASAFADVSRGTATGEHEVELKIREVTDRLSGQGAPTDVVQSVADRLGTATDVPAPASQIVVATDRGVALDEVVHASTPRTTATWGALPDIGDWIECEDAVIAFVLALVDHEGGEVVTYGTGDGIGDETTGAPADHEHKTRGGGLAHRRYQRTAENAWGRNAEAVAEVLTSRIADGFRLVILAGDPKSRSQVRDALGPAPAVEVVELEHGGRPRDGGDAELHDAIHGVLTEQSIAIRLRLVHDLKDRLGSGSGAVTGVRDVADAFVRGQVATLLIDPSEAADLELDPRDHPGLALSGMPTNEPVRADLGLVAAAARTDADVVVSPSSTLYGTPIAALLRWEGAENS